MSVFSSIKVIAFDLFGVLISEGHLVSAVLMPMLPADIHYTRVKQQYQRYNLRQIDEHEFWESLGLNHPDPIRNRFLDRLLLDPQCQPVVEALLPYFQLSILSNLPADWADYLSQKYDFDRFFEPIIFSGHYAEKKPQPEIYQRLLSQLEVNAGQVLFVDDRLENLQAAASAGIKTVYFKREHEQFRFVPDATITDLSQLLACLQVD